MTETMQQILARKQERRKQLAALPVGEKLRMLEEMVATAKAIRATQPTKPAHAMPVETAGSQFFGSGPIQLPSDGPECGA